MKTLTILVFLATLAACGKAATTTADVLAETLLDTAVELADAATGAVAVADAASPADAAPAAGDVTPAD